MWLSQLRHCARKSPAVVGSARDSEERHAQHRTLVVSGTAFTVSFRFFSVGSHTHTRNPSVDAWWSIESPDLFVLVSGCLLWAAAAAAEDMCGLFPFHPTFPSLSPHFSSLRPCGNEGLGDSPPTNSIFPHAEIELYHALTTCSGLWMLVVIIEGRVNSRFCRVTQRDKRA